MGIIMLICMRKMYQKTKAKKIMKVLVIKINLILRATNKLSSNHYVSKMKVGS